MELELKYIVPYLPYGLDIKILNYKCDYVGIEFAKADGFYNLLDEFYVTYVGGSTGKSINDFKPLLLPLSELKVGDAKWEYLQKQYNPKNDINWKIDVWLTTGEEEWHPFASLKDNFAVQSPLPLSAYLKFFEWHFDVFGLIDAGLALNKNDYIKN